MAVKVNSENIKSEVLDSDIPVILEFYSDSCIPCKALSPVLGEIEDENEGKLKVCKVNTAYQTELAQNYEILSTPTMVFFQNGEEIDRLSGVHSKDDILEIFGGI